MNLPPGGQSRDGPIYRRITESLRTSITSGEFAVGGLIPTESELCKKFSASRHTIREAIRRLTEVGLVERRQGSGTRVIASLPKFQFVHSVNSLAELFEYTRETVLDVHDVQLVGLTVGEAEEVQAPIGSHWLRARGLRLSADREQTICYVHIFAPARFAGLLEDIRMITGPIYATLEARSGETVFDALQEISSRPMPRIAAVALKTRTGAASFRVTRRYLDRSGATMLVAINWHSAKDFRYAIHLRRSDVAPLSCQG